MVATSSTAPKRTTSQPALVGLQDRILRRGERLAAALSSPESAPHPFRLTIKDALLEVISDIATLLGHVEPLVPTLSTREASGWRDRVQRIRTTLVKIIEAVDHAAGLAIQGRLDKQVLWLSPIANGANLSEGMRLRRLETRLTERLAHNLAESEMVADPDLLAVPYISFHAEIQQGRAEPGASDGSQAVQLGDAASREQREFQACLDRISAPDELERNEALVALIREYQHWLIATMLGETSSGDRKLASVLDVLSHHAELVLLEDYFFSDRRMKLSHLLAVGDSHPASAFFRRLLSIFHTRAGTASNVEHAVASFDNPIERETLMRVLLFHPMREYRSFAAAQLSPAQLWPVASHPHAPVLALGDVLRRLEQEDISDDFRRVFFDCTCRRIQNVKAVAEVRAAREMLSRFFAFDFFMEDNYFKRLLKLNGSVEEQEKRLGIETPFFRKSLATFLMDKDRVGSKKTQLPKSFTDVPLTVQRKLARDGYYLTLFIRHPHAKVALETLPYVSSVGRAEQVLGIRTANRRLIAEIAKRDELVASYKARFALVSHPKAPLKFAVRHIPYLRQEDVARLSESHDINPEVRRHLTTRYGGPARKRPTG